MSEATEQRDKALALGRFQPGPDPRRWRGPPPEVMEVKRLAREHAKEAFERLLHLVANGSAAVQVQAAKAVLGIAGVTLQPGSQSREGAGGLPSAPVTMDLRALVALVRGVPLPSGEGSVGAMPRLSPPPGTAPPTAPSGSVDAEYSEITGENGDSGRTTQPSSSAPSGSQPDGQEA